MIMKLVMMMMVPIMKESEDDSNHDGVKLTDYQMMMRFAKTVTMTTTKNISNEGSGTTTRRSTRCP